MGVVEIVERAYDVDAPVQSWLEGIREAAERAFGDGVLTQAYTYTVSPAGAFQLHWLASDPDHGASMRQSHALASAPVIRAVYLRSPVTNVDRAVAGSEGDDGARNYKDHARQGAHVTLMHGLDPSGRGCSLSLISDSAAKFATRALRPSLHRISAHLAAAYRLRGLSDGVGSSRAADSQAEAVLSADGRVVHAERGARALTTRSALCDAARRIDRARMRCGAMSTPEERLALWRALVDGQWSLIERFDSDGRRLFVARRNDPSSHAHRSLSDMERKVVALLALGHSQKLCAYELGRCEGTVSTLARAAMTKLGVKDRHELVEICGAILGTDGCAATPPQALAQ